MKTTSTLFGIFVCAFALKADDMMAIDQLSKWTNYVGNTYVIQSNAPVGQSFTPNFDGVDFIQIGTRDDNMLSSNGIGATLVINLRNGGIAGEVMASTAPILLADNFFNVTTGYFPSRVALTPGRKYYFDVQVLSGDPWVVTGYHYGYLGGEMYLKGIPRSEPWDLWFQEGIIVPEPQTAWLLGLGGLGLWIWRRKGSG